MIELFGFIEGIGWDPFLRGALTVVTGVVVLMGSVYLIVATNTGVRSGLLISLAALFGWFAIMGVIWTMYGIGLAGKRPAWEVIEVNRGDLASAQLEQARDLSDWAELPPENPARSDAQAAVDAYLVASGEFPDTQAYLPLDGFEIGGKPKRSSDGMWDRITNKVSNTFRRHPIHHLVIEVQGVTPESLILTPGQPPPPKEADSAQPVVSVIMVRNLGTLRRQPMLFTIASGTIFAALAWMLHDRDKRMAAIRGQYAAAA